MRSDVRRTLIPALALLVTFSVGGVFVYWILSLYGGDPAPAAAPTTSSATSIATASATRTAPTASPAPTLAATSTVPPATPVGTAAATPVTTPAATAAPLVPPTSFAGRWRVVDTVEEGTGVGQAFAFDVAITQTGAALSGSAPGVIVFTGTVVANFVTVEFSQPTLGVTGIFIWTMQPDGSATGTFTSSIPNSGTSHLERLR